jgi:hypothetical protein
MKNLSNIENLNQLKVKLSLSLTKTNKQDYDELINYYIKKYNINKDVINHKKFLEKLTNNFELFLSLSSKIKLELTNISNLLGSQGYFGSSVGQLNNFELHWKTLFKSKQEDLISSHSNRRWRGSFGIYEPHLYENYLRGNLKNIDDNDIYYMLLNHILLNELDNDVYSKVISYLIGGWYDYDGDNFKIITKSKN